MPWDSIVIVARLGLAALGLVLVGRLLRTARIYASWWAFLSYGLAWLALAALGLARLLAPQPGLLGLVLEAAVYAGAAGSLLAHLRADRRRHADSRRLIEQWQRASGQARQRAGELEVLAGITAQLVSTLELPSLLQSVVEQALRVTGAEAVAVYLLDDQDGRLRGQGVSAAADPRAAPLPTPRPQGLTARAAREGEPLFVDETTRELQLPAGPGSPVRALAAVPLRLEGGVVGVLNVLYRRPHRFGDDDRRMLLALAHVAALAIHNATQHERLARLATTDDLTGLPNRRRFLEALRTEAHRARRYQRALALLMLDLDGLKEINDRHGHAAGDEVLRGVAQVLRASTRDTDLPARLGGDEFAVLLPETEAEAGGLIAERIRAGVVGLAVPAADGAPVSASLGLVSGAGAALTDLPRFMRLADDALYQAKGLGRNRLVVVPGTAGAARAKAASGVIPPKA